MSRDEKASAAAAQLLIDDEPDDWYVELRVAERSLELTRWAGTSGSSAPDAQVPRRPMAFPEFLN